MKQFLVCFVEFGVDFASSVLDESLADELLTKLAAKGITTAYKFEVEPSIG